MWSPAFCLNRLRVASIKLGVSPDDTWRSLLRWAASGRGKRGGARVIYYKRLSDGVIWLLVI